MEFLSTTLYNKQNEPAGEINFWEKDENKVSWGMSLVGEGDTYNEMTGGFISSERADKQTSQGFVMNRALRRIHNLCEEDFIMYCNVLECSSKISNAPFQMCGTIHAPFRELLRIMVK